MDKYLDIIKAETKNYLSNKVNQNMKMAKKLLLTEVKNEVNDELTNDLKLQTRKMETNIVIKFMNMKK